MHEQRISPSHWLRPHRCQTQTGPLASPWRWTNLAGQIGRPSTLMPPTRYGLQPCRVPVPSPINWPAESIAQAYRLPAISMPPSIACGLISRLSTLRATRRTTISTTRVLPPMHSCSRAARIFPPIPVPRPSRVRLERSQKPANTFENVTRTSAWARAVRMRVSIDRPCTTGLNRSRLGGGLHRAVLGVMAPPRHARTTLTGNFD